MMTPEQLRAITISERTMSVLSMLGSLFIMGTFITWHYFRKPINRLVFYASFGNVLANVGTLIGTAAVRPVTESLLPLCKFQAIIIQWFMLADSLWVLCMAANVMLVFFHHYNSRDLRRLEKWYLCFAYGIPFIPILSYLIVESATHQPVFGPATLWCWIHPRVEWMRLAFFYVPVWCCLSFTIVVYSYTGYHIFTRGKRVASARPRTVTTVENPFVAMNAIERTTEISVKYTADSAETGSTVVDHKGSSDSRSSFSSTRNLSSTQQSSPTTVTVQPISSLPQADNSNRSPSAANDRHLDANPHYKAAVTGVKNANHNPNHHRNLAMEQNHAAWSYFKVAFLMFSALFIVWVPSTINRIQQFVQPGHPRFSLNLMSALVLPLQGFWNSMVYISTTWPECKRAWRNLYCPLTGGKNCRVRAERQARQDSDRTLTGSGNDTQEFDAIDEIPLRETLKQGHQQLRSEEYIPNLPRARASSYRPRSSD